MARARGRTWTLETLDRSREYALWFDQAENRWEVGLMGDGGPLVTRHRTRPEAGPPGASGARQGVPPDGVEPRAGRHSAHGR